MFVRLLLTVVVLIAACTAVLAKDDDSEKGDEQIPEITVPIVTTVDTIEVVGSILGGEIPGAVHRVELSDAILRNQAVGDIHRVLFSVPGVNIQEEEGYGLRPNIGMRGTSIDRSQSITLMEDAVLIAPAPYAAPAAYYFPVAGRMSGVEVRKGSSQIKYGPRTNGGALNLISTPVPRETHAHVGLVYGEDDTRKAYINYGDTRGHVGWLLETYQIENDGFKLLDTGGPTGFDVEDYVGKLEFTTSASARVFQKLTLKGGYARESSNETYLGLSDDDFTRSPLRRYASSQVDQMNWEHTQAQARWLVMPAEWTSITTTVYRNDFSRNWYKLDKVGGVSISSILEDPSSYATEFAYIRADSASPDDALAVKANNRDYYSQGIDSQVRFSGRAIAANHELEIGVRYHMDEEDRFQHSDGYRIETDGTMTKTSAGVPGQSGGGNNRVNSARAFAAYAQDNISFGRWIVTGGVRFEHIELKREQYGVNDAARQGAVTTTVNKMDVVLPGVGVSYELIGGGVVFGGVHKGFAPPGPGTTTNSKPEESVNYEAGLRYASGRQWYQFIAFYNDYENLLGRDTFSSGGSGSGDLFNAGEVRSFGAEAAIQLELLRTQWMQLSVPFGLSYTYTNATFQNSFKSSFGPWGDVEKGDYLPYIPEHQLSGSLALDTHRWLVGLSASYVSKTPTEALQGDIPDNKSVDERLVVDATAEYDIFTTMSLFASARNITNELYITARRPAGVRPGLPRRFMVGLNFDL